MSERAEHIGATLSIVSSPSRGSTVEVVGPTAVRG